MASRRHLGSGVGRNPTTPYPSYCIHLYGALHCSNVCVVLLTISLFAPSLPWKCAYVELKEEEEENVVTPHMYFIIIILIILYSRSFVHYVGLDCILIISAMYEFMSIIWRGDSV